MYILVRIEDHITTPNQSASFIYSPYEEAKE
jgi:hypothetical protein